VASTEDQMYKLSTQSLSGRTHFIPVVSGALIWSVHTIILNLKTFYFCITRCLNNGSIFRLLHNIITMLCLNPSDDCKKIQGVHIQHVHVFLRRINIFQLVIQNTLLTKTDKTTIYMAFSPRLNYTDRADATCR
jgi:hypothetical protein